MAPATVADVSPDRLAELFAFCEHGADFAQPRRVPGNVAVNDKGFVEVQSSHFQEPCHSMQTSGGTAAFFYVALKEGVREELARDFYVGKDVARAEDELEFYEHMSKMATSHKCWYDLSKVSMECPGVVDLPCILTDKAGTETNEQRSLLLLENLRSGYRKMRQLDVKLGAETAVSGWKGKSAIRAWKQSTVDSFTNSKVEGFRLEGMEEPPQCLEDYLEMAVNNPRAAERAILSEKKAKRLMLQRLRGYQIIDFWVNMQDATTAGKRSRLNSGASSHVGGDSFMNGVHSQASYWPTLSVPLTSGTASKRLMAHNMNSEAGTQTITNPDLKSGVFAELHCQDALWQALDKVSDCAKTVLALPVPQQWIGSSLALALEVDECEEHPKTTVKLFDWGRSDLSSVSDYKALSPSEKKERIQHWRSYLRSLLRFQYELARIVVHRCCCPAWTALVCELCDDGQDPACAALYELPKDLTSASTTARRVRLPVKLKGINIPCATISLLVKVKKLPDGRIRYMAEPRVLENVTNVLQQQRQDLEVVSVRITAFELKGDAEKYMKGWFSGSTQPYRCKGKAFAQSTCQKRLIDTQTEGHGIAAAWTDSLEFLAAGPAAQERQQRAESAIFISADAQRPKVGSIGVMSTLLSEAELPKVPEGQSWPPFLPPTTHNNFSQIDSAAQNFISFVAPHVQENGPTLPGWR